MSGSSGEKLCPICDSPIQPGSKKCAFCGTDLSIFDMDAGKSEPAKSAPPPPAPKPSMESRVREVLSPPPKAQPAPAPAPEPKPRPAEAPPQTASTLMPSPKPATQPVQKAPTPVVAEPPKLAEPVAEVKAHGYFDCPECGVKVEEHASSCPGCGVMFAEEGTEMFQCPACNTLVSIDSKTCPGCGAMFVESEEEAPAEERARQAEIEVEAPIAEVKPPAAEPILQREPEPEPVRTARKEPEPTPEREPAGKKGFGGLGWFKKRKKEPELEEDVEEPVRPRAPAAAPAQVPVKTYEEQTRIAEPEPEAREPAPAPPAQVQKEPATPDTKAKGKELARMLAEMKPLLTLAYEKDIDVTESKKLIDEAAEAGRDRQLDNALEFVNRSKGLMMARIDDHLASAIMQLKEETDVAKSLGGDVSRALTYLHEIEKAKAAGDAEAAFVYAERVSNELLPITGRYKEARNRTAALRSLVADCEILILDTKEARAALSEANRAFEANDFDRVEMLVKQATDRLYRAIPDRVNEEMHSAKAQLIEAKMKNVNTTPMITILKSVRTLMKSGDYSQALKEMKDFKEQMRKVM